ncbi:MAG: hypothetical protein AAFY55_18910, partial [Bacteroidota bacterium]
EAAAIEQAALDAAQAAQIRAALAAVQNGFASGEPMEAALEDLADALGEPVPTALSAVAEGAPTLAGLQAAFPEAARVDSGVREGDAISPFYDPMIAKVICHGEDRTAALAALDRALAETQIAGLTCNLAFLRRLIRVPDFVAGSFDTGLIAGEGSALTEDARPCSKTQALAAVGALGLHGPRSFLSGFSLWAPLTQTARLSFGGEIIDIAVETHAESFRA